MKVDVKSLIPVFSIVAVLGGFYYTTEHRLTQLEEEIETLKEDIAKLRKSINRKLKKSD